MVKITVKSKVGKPTEYITEGFVGDSCLKFTKRLEELMALEGVVVADKEVKRTRDEAPVAVQDSEHVGA